MHKFKQEALVSVIIPTHNRADMLLRAIKSVLAQKYSNIEVIVVADFCTDNTRGVVENISDKRIIFLSLDKNVGGAQARNIGLDIAKGKFIAFLDDDDEWLENKIVEQINVLNKYSDVAIVSTDYFFLNGSEVVGTSNIKENITVNDLLYYNYCGSFSFCMTKKSFINDLRINPKLKSCQDWDLWLKILLHTGLRCQVVKAPSPLVIYQKGHVNKITNDHQNAVKSFIYFLRNYWHHMNDSQKNYQLYKLMKWKRKRFGLKIGYIDNIRMFVKALKYYRKSEHNQKISKYLLLLPQILKFKKLVSNPK